MSNSDKIKPKWNGRFVSQKKYEYLLSCSERGKRNKGRVVCQQPTLTSKFPVLGDRVINIEHMAKQMYCTKCKNKLHFDGIQSETKRGFGSYFTTKCSKCGNLDRIESGPVHTIPGQNKSFESNSNAKSLKLSTETSSETKLVCVDGLPFEDYNSDDQFSIEYSAAPRWSSSFNREDESISMVPQQTSNVKNSENQPSSVEFNRTKIETLDIPTDAIESSLPVNTYKPSTIVLNDLDSYETYLISKLRSYNPIIRSKVQELFNEIIFKADTGVFNKNDSVPTSSPIHNISPEYVEIIPHDTSDKYFIKEEADSKFVEDYDLLKASSDFQDSPDLVSTKTLERSFEQDSKQYYQQRNNMKGSKKQVSTLTTPEPPLQAVCIPSSEFSLSIKEEIFIEEHEMENINEEDNSFTESTAYKSSLTVSSKSMECSLESNTVKYEMPVKCEHIQIDK